jgi:uncharacterized protein YcbK (DUF882 family)
MRDSTKTRNTNAIDRRRFLGLCVGIAGTMIIKPAAASIASRPRELSFDHLHTGEKIKLAYWENGSYLRDALKAVNHVLRDFRTGDVHRIDPKLLDLLYHLRAKLGTTKPIEVISGYRSPKTNEMLRRASAGVAKHSMHLQGKAIDIRVPGQDLRQVHRVALALRAGGVGMYPKSDFVHVDTGRVRSW